MLVVSCSTRKMFCNDPKNWPGEKTLLLLLPFYKLYNKYFSVRRTTNKSTSVCTEITQIIFLKSSVRCVEKRPRLGKAQAADENFFREEEIMEGSRS